MSVRYVRHGSKGYALLRVDGDDVEGVGPRYVAVHRVAAYAWGVLDGLDDPREVDHLDRVRWHNAERNLDAVEPETHGRRTRARERPVCADGSGSPPKWVVEALPFDVEERVD